MNWSIWKTLQSGGKDVNQLIREIEQANCKISSWARDMMGQKDFTTSLNSQDVNFVKIKVRDLGFTEMPTTDEHYARAQAQGLELCLPEDGPTLRANYLNQLKGEVIWMAMKQIADSGGCPSVFGLYHGGDGLWLDGGVAGPDDRWYLVDEFVFRLSKKSS